MKVFGLAGWSGSGKTTLLVRLLPILARHGIAVSTVKHAHHDFDIDRPGKDSYRHREAGAVEVMVASGHRWALMREHRAVPEPTLGDLLARMTPVDLVIVEGFKFDPHPKLEVHRPALAKPLICDGDRHVVAVASDAPLAGIGLPVLDLDDAEGIAGFIAAHCGLR
ncbi:MAG: molybdopterin-guanine dinucleotide biosynthesis protein B [Alphaproteobacteria bacterium]